MRVSIIRPVHGLVALSLVFPWTAGYAHEGEDHTSSQSGPIATGVSPRAEAASENFELVAVARGGTLTVYLDRRSSNEPVTGATVSVETPPAAWTPSRTSTAPTRSLRRGRRSRAVTTSFLRLRATAQPRC